MIKASDLRVGNTLQYFIGEDGCEWESTTLDWQDIKWAQEKNDNFNLVHKPIPLTPELLEKCGFEWETEKHSHLEMETVAGHLLTFYYDKGILESIQFYTVDSSEAYFHPPDNFRFLHQLQNLYFALTGSELEVNLI